jgi:hypothetical protein
VERRSKRGVDSNRYRFGVAVNMDRDGSRTRFSAKWNGNSLLVESGSYAGPAGSSAHHTGGGELWSLDAQGSLVITATERASGAEPRTTTLTYRRR